MVEQNENDPLERADHARWRAGLYRSASASFQREPTDEELAVLVGAAGAGVASGAWTFSCERDLLEHLASYDVVGARLGTRVRTEYAELFVGPRPPLAPLYESLYVGSPRRLCTDVTRHVREAYERCGLRAEACAHVPDDHIGYELEFMAVLCERQADAAVAGCFEEEKACLSHQARFLVEHLAVWTTPFRERVERAACGDYYRAWARFVDAFVAEDARWLGAGAGAIS